MFRLTLALLLAGFAAVSATNSSSSSSSASTTTTGGGGATTTGGGGGANVTATTGAPATTTTGTVTTGAAATTTTGTVTTGAAATTTTGTVTTGAAATTTTSTATTGAPATTTTGGTSGSSTNGTGTSSAGNTTAAADKEVKMVKSSIELKLPIGTETGAELIIDDGFTGPFRTSIAAAASVQKEDVFITSIVVGSRLRVRQLTNTNSTAKTVKVDFTIKTSKTADVVQSNLRTSVADKTNSGFAKSLATNGIKVGTTTLEVDHTQSIPAPQVVPFTAKLKTQGSFTMMWYASKNCAGAAATTKTGTIGSAKATCAKGSTTTGSVILTSCTTQGLVSGDHFKGAADCTGTVSAFQGTEGVCVRVDDTNSLKVSCSSSGSASTSDASTKSLVGVVFGIIMGLVTLM